LAAGSYLAMLALANLDQPQQREIVETIPIQPLAAKGAEPQGAEPQQISSSPLPVGIQGEAEQQQALRNREGRRDRAEAHAGGIRAWSKSVAIGARPSSAARRRR
jgi:hypothetical protein